MIRGSKYNEARDVPKPKVIKWEATEGCHWSVEVDRYLLLVEECGADNFYWTVFYGDEKIASSGDYNMPNSAQKAKNASVFQMTKHKKSLIRKMVNQ